MARKALTLLEVLIAIFIMGVGMLCVLAIFPVAAFMMGQSIQNYRVNDAVINTENLSEGYLREKIYQNPNVLVDSFTGSTLSSTSPFFRTSQLSNPINESFYPLMNPKYIFVDQYANIGQRGVLANIRTSAVNLFTPPTNVVWSFPSLKRTSVPVPGFLAETEPLLTPTIVASRYFTLNTDTDIDESGSTGSGGTINRTGAYTISYLWENSNPLYGNTPTRRHMLVFKNRSELYEDFDFENVPLTLTSDYLNYPGQVVVPGQLDYKKGNWIMAQVVHPLDPNGLQILKVSFHKITAINERPAGIELEIQPKMTAVSVPPYQPSHSGTNAYTEFLARPLAVTTSTPAPTNPATLQQGIWGINKVYLLKDVVRVVDLGN